MKREGITTPIRTPMGDAEGAMTAVAVIKA